MKNVTGRAQLQLGGHKLSHALLTVSFELYLYSHDNFVEDYTALSGNTDIKGESTPTCKLKSLAHLPSKLITVHCSPSKVVINVKLTLSRVLLTLHCYVYHDFHMHHMQLCA